MCVQGELRVWLREAKESYRRKVEQKLQQHEGGLGQYESHHRLQEEQHYSGPGCGEGKPVQLGLIALLLLLQSA